MADESSNTPESRTVRRKRDWLPWAILASLFVHTIFVIVFGWLSWLFAAHLVARLPQEFKGQSTAITIERRNRPRISPHEPKRVARQAPARPARARKQTATRPKPQHQAPPRRELTHNVAAAPYQPPRSVAHPSFSQQLSQQERDFAREAKHLHAENSPLSVSTAAPNPAAFHQQRYDASGRYTQTESTYAWLLPVKHWVAKGQSCYYVHYDMNTSTGGAEHGYIPWPICYPQNHDAMLPLDRSHNLPVPYPPPGFTLASGTYLSPFLRGIYDHNSTP